MSNRSRGLIAVAAAAFLSVARLAAAQTSAGVLPQPRAYHLFLTGEGLAIVNAALQGAVRRLSTPRCQQLFDDFTDRAGHALASNLVTAEKSPVDFLAGLYFVDGDDTIQCQTDLIMSAFTEPGSRVIHVCTRRFAQFGLKKKSGEILLIHELLHALGLGENPPTSSQITKAVMNRCG